MVYIYEKLADGLHRYATPAPGTSINLARYVSNGYILLQPDIVYETGYPGSSAMKCVLPAVQKVVGEGLHRSQADRHPGPQLGRLPDHLHDHPDRHLRRRRGRRLGHEHDQRLRRDPLGLGHGPARSSTRRRRAGSGRRSSTRALQFIENSPLFWAERVKTPYLTIHNDEDDAVPWYQGIEFFTALRRLGKEAYMFVYNGEKHGLRERENQKNWTVHLDEFFDHYLLGGPRPAWMDKGVPYLERGKRDVTRLLQEGGQEVSGFRTGEFGTRRRRARGTIDTVRASCTSMYGRSADGALLY